MGKEVLMPLALQAEAKRARIEDLAERLFVQRYGVNGFNASALQAFESARTFEGVRQAERSRAHE